MAGIPCPREMIAHLAGALAPVQRPPRRERRCALAGRCLEIHEPFGRSHACASSSDTRSGSTPHRTAGREKRCRRARRARGETLAHRHVSRSRHRCRRQPACRRDCGRLAGGGRRRRLRARRATAPRDQARRCLRRDRGSGCREPPREPVENRLPHPIGCRAQAGHVGWKTNLPAAPGAADDAHLVAGRCRHRFQSRWGWGFCATSTVDARLWPTGVRLRRPTDPERRSS